jgi:hypothetical protein
MSSDGCDSPSGEEDGVKWSKRRRGQWKAGNHSHVIDFGLYP